MTSNPGVCAINEAREDEYFKPLATVIGSQVGKLHNPDIGVLKIDVDTTDCVPF